MSCPIKERQRETLLQKTTNVRTETGFYTASFDHGGRDPEQRNERNVSSMRKGRKRILPKILWRECGSVATPILAQ